MIGENNWQAYTRISNIKIIGSRRGFSRDDGLHELRRMIEIIYALAECIRRNFLDGSHCIHGALFFCCVISPERVVNRADCRTSEKELGTQVIGA